VAPGYVLDPTKVPIPFAILTPDGEWHAEGIMDPYGRIYHRDRDWENTARDLWAECSENVLIVVDCCI
jgi:hypothetical protein